MMLLSLFLIPAPDVPQPKTPPNPVVYEKQVALLPKEEDLSKIFPWQKKKKDKKKR